LKKYRTEDTDEHTKTYDRNKRPIILCQTRVKYYILMQYTNIRKKKTLEPWISFDVSSISLKGCTKA